MLRASGVNWDLRKVRPYMGYEQYDFNVPIYTEGDTYARYIIRVEEMRRSLKIVEQALKNCRWDPCARTTEIHPAAALGAGREHGALIHHFKLWTEGFPAPDGSIYQAVESPRGELGVLLAGDGGAKPRRCHWRTPLVRQFIGAAEDRQRTSCGGPGCHPGFCRHCARRY